MGKNKNRNKGLKKRIKPAKNVLFLDELRRKIRPDGILEPKNRAQFMGFLQGLRDDIGPNFPNLIEVMDNKNKDQVLRMGLLIKAFYGLNLVLDLDELGLRVSQEHEEFYLQPLEVLGLISWKIGEDHD